MREDACWLESRGASWGFIGPLAIMLLINVSLFAVVVRQVRNEGHGHRQQRGQGSPTHEEEDNDAASDSRSTSKRRLWVVGWHALHSWCRKQLHWGAGLARCCCGYRLRAFLALAPLQGLMWITLFVAMEGSVATAYIFAVLTLLQVSRSVVRGPVVLRRAGAVVGDPSLSGWPWPWLVRLGGGRDACCLCSTVRWTPG